VPRRRVHSFRLRLLKWFAEHGRSFPWRRPNESVYRMVVVEVLLQRTQAAAVSGFYRVFFRDFPSWRRLSMATLGSIEQSLRPLGLWRKRAIVLGRLAEAVSQRGGHLPKERGEIEALPGVGQYVANAIELIRWGRPRPLLDANMARVLERYFGPRLLADIRYDPYLQQLAHWVVDCKSPRALNWAALDLAAMVCRPWPRCSACPIRRGCNRARGVSGARDDQC